MSEQYDWGYGARAAEILRGLGVTPILIGALAALEFRATDRSTTDVDFLIPHDVPGIVQAFEAEGLQVRAMSGHDGGVYLYMVKGGGDIMVDIIVAETPYQDEAYRRAVNGHLTVEDVIVHKLIAWRARDRDDIRSILDAGHALDGDYIERWAREWDAFDRWEQAKAWTE